MVEATVGILVFSAEDFTLFLACTTQPTILCRFR